MVFCGQGDGINVHIICIVMLFLAEYCGFDWVVGAFFWIFWFCFRNSLKMLYFHFFKVRLKICRGIRGGRRPTTTPGKFSSELLKKWKYNIFKRLRKQNQNIQTKVPTTHPNPQYSAKNNVTIHMIHTFMPPPLQQTTMLYCYIILALHSTSRNSNVIISNRLLQDWTNSCTTWIHLS